MTRYLTAAAVAVLFLPALSAAEPLAEGNWQLGQMMRPGLPPSAMLTMKVEKKDGKYSATLVEEPGKKNAWHVGNIKVDGQKVSVELSVNKLEYTFEGQLNDKNPKEIRGALQTDERAFRFVMSAVDENAKTPGIKPPPPPMAEVNKLTAAVAQLRSQAARSKDVNEKGDLQAKMKEAQKEADEKVPGLLREVIEKHADSPHAVLAAGQLLATAAKAKATAGDIAAWAKILIDDAETFGPRIASDTALSNGETLIGQKEVAGLALPLAEKVVANLKDKDALAVQSRALKLLIAAQKAAGKNDAGLLARLEKVEGALDVEYMKKVPPFKPAKFAGRKDKDANRVVVMELFTGAQCPPCVAADVAFDALEKAYGHDELVLIQYHMHIPGPDPLTNLDTIARWDYYKGHFPMDVRGTPTTLFNGAVKAPGGGGMANAESKYGQYSQIINELLEEKSTIKIGGSAKQSGDKVVVDVSVDGVKDASDKLKMRVLLVEETIKYVGGNGLRFHHQVVRAVPDAKEGTPIAGGALKKSVAINLAEVKQNLTTYLDNYAANERPFPYPDRPMDLKNLKAIVLVQNDATGEILNAAQFDVK